MREGTYPPFETWPDILSPAYIQKYFRMSPNTVYNGLRRKEIPGRFICGRWMIGKYELGVYLGAVSPNYGLEKELSKLHEEIAGLKRLLSDIQELTKERS